MLGRQIIQQRARLAALPSGQPPDGFLIRRFGQQLGGKADADGVDGLLEAAGKATNRPRCLRQAAQRGPEAGDGR